MRWLIGLALLVVLAVAGDAALRSYAEGRIEARLASEFDSRARPDVSLGGFPFAVRLLTGRVPTVTLEARAARRGGLEIKRLVLDLEGVHMSLDTGATAGDADVRIERGEGFAEIDLQVLGDYIERRTPVRVIGFEGGRVTIALGGRRATVPLRLEGGAIVIETPSRDEVAIPLPQVLEGIGYSAIKIRDDLALLTFRLHNATLRSI